MEANDQTKAVMKLLEDPESLSKVMGMVGAIMKNMPSNKSEAVPEEKSSEAFDNYAENSAHTNADPTFAPDLSMLPALLGGLNKNTAANAPDCALLSALKPYMAHGRAEKIDKLINILRLTQIAGGFFHGGTQ